MILYFSGNGNSEYIAGQLARLTHDKAYSITEAPPSELNAKIVGLVFPVHAWGLPRIMEQFIGQIPISSAPNYLYAVCTCGDDIGRTDRLLRHQLHHRGLFMDAIWSVQMGNTYIALPGFDVDTPEVVDRKHAALSARLGHIADCIGQRMRDIADVAPGAMPRTKSYVLRPLFYRFLTGDHRFRTTSACIGCGQCATCCPTHNIHLDNGRPEWSGHCTDCLRCYHRCPLHAIRYGRWSEGKGQYRFTPLDLVPSHQFDLPVNPK